MAAGAAELKPEATGTAGAEGEAMRAAETITGALSAEGMETGAAEAAEMRLGAMVADATGAELTATNVKETSVEAADAAEARGRAERRAKKFAAESVVDPGAGTDENESGEVAG